MRESERISVLKGVGEKTEQLFIKAGVHTIGDLLAYYPRTYDIYEDPISIGEIQEGKTVTVTGAIFGRIQVSQNKKMQITTLYLKDMTGTLKVIWFRMPFLRNTLGRGGVITLRGRIVRKKGRTGDGASGDFLSQCLLRGKKKYNAARLCPDGRTDQ